MQSGYRSLLGFYVGGAGKSPSKGAYAGPRSMLAFWMGGAALPLAIVPPFPVRLEDGLAYRRHPRVIRDDQEIIDFLQTWTLWNDIEGP